MRQLGEFTNLLNAFEDGVQRGLHSGLQIYVSLDSQPTLSAGLGESRPGVPLSESTIMPWRSAGKPITAFVVMKRIEESRLRLETCVGDVLTEARTTDKADITIQQLLTHQSGFPQTDTGWPQVGWDESVARSLRSPCQLPVGTAAYHPQSSWFILGEILRRLESDSGETSFAEILSRDVFSPLGMTNVWCGIPSDEQEQLASRLPVLVRTHRRATAAVKLRDFTVADHTVARRQSICVVPSVSLGSFSKCCSARKPVRWPSVTEFVDSSSDDVGSSFGPVRPNASAHNRLRAWHHARLKAIRHQHRPIRLREVLQRRIFRTWRLAVFNRIRRP